MTEDERKSLIWLLGNGAKDVDLGPLIAWIDALRACAKYDERDRWERAVGHSIETAEELAWSLKQ